MRVPIRTGLALSLLIAACGGGADGPRSVLLVTVDTLRADRLGSYGYSGADTPFTDALAERGVRFEQVFSVAPITLPSHVSLLTGTIPPSHGVRDNGGYQAVPELLTLAEILREEGFRTAAFTAAFVLDSQFGLDQGFEVYGDVPQRQVNPSGQIEERSAHEVNLQAFGWFDALGEDESFFCWLHYFEPHLPYPPPERLPPVFRDRPYDAEVSLADHALGEVLKRLERMGRIEETLVVFTSDHGESLGEHGELTHSFFVYQGVLSVPLIFTHRSLPQGRTVRTSASLVDVMPTVLELLGLDTPITPPPGRSLAGAIRGEGLEERPAYFESLSPYLNYGWAPLKGVAVGDHKLIQAPRPELYDLSDDPAEARNLHAEAGALANSLELELRELLAANDAGERLGTARRDLTAEDRARLVSLGYTGAAFPAEGEKTLADPKDGIARVRKEESITELYRQGRSDEGFALLDELLAEDPNNPLFNAHYASLLAEQRRHAEAIPYARRAIRGGLRTVDGVCNLAMCLLFTDQLPAAKQAFEEALAINGKHLLSLYWLAEIHLRLGEQDEARRRLESILEHWEGAGDSTIRRVRQRLDSLSE